MMSGSLTFPLLLKAAPILIPVAAKLAKHMFDTDSKLLNDLIELAIEKGEDEAKGKLEAALKQKPDVVLAWHQHVFIDYTGWVLGQLVQHFSQQPQFSAEKKELEQLAAQAPEGWKTYVLSGSPGLSPVHHDIFLRQMAAALSRGEELPPINTVPFITFFNWHVRLSPELQQRLATHLRTHLDNAIQLFLVSEDSKASPAYKLIILDGIGGIHASLKTLHQKMDVTVPVIVDTNERVQQLQMGQDQLLGPLVEMMKGKTKEERLDQYKRALLAAFKPYQELAIDNFAAAEQTSPDIWDIFVHPACSENHLRPEEMDAAQRETPPRLPAADLLPLLAQDEHRRTVLLGDPGMGKSTLIQALIAHLASGRSFAEAKELNGLLPVALILRDLVPLLPQDQVESWSWDALLDTFLCHYQRDEAAPKLCDAFKDHLPEFRQHLHTDPKVFFLIDGLDEIGDLVKRRKIVKCIQDGIRAVSKEARWLITSRVIGYADAAADIADFPMNLREMADEFYASREVKRGEELHQIVAAFRQGWRRWELDAFRSMPSAGDLESFRDGMQLIGQLREAAMHEYLEILFRPISIAKRLYLAPFDDRRQDAFTQRWFQRRHSTDYSKELMREVRAHHHDGVRIISRVPNLLCLMNILKRSGKPLPDGRAALYDEIVKAYLGGIDAAYRLRPVLGNTCPFDAEQRRFLLCLLGAHMQQVRSAYMQATPEIDQLEEAEMDAEIEGGSFGKDGNILVSRPDLKSLLEPAIQRMCDERRVSSQRGADELLDELLHHIASRSGLLIPRSSDEHGEALYSFTHLSFLEFFAAEWLGMEFDRRQRQLARQTEAMQDGELLTPQELEELFPAQGPITHDRIDFPALAASPAWHEPLIFLLETRKADALTLLRWFFPVLHPGGQRSVLTGRKPADRHQALETSSLKPETPLLPLDAVRLLVKLAADPEIPVPVEKRREWWQTLWDAYLKWPHTPWDHPESRRWPIAPLLLERPQHRPEVLQTLSQAVRRHPGQPLYLNRCHQLTTADLSCLTGLAGLEELDLTGCRGLRSTKGLPPLTGLKQLYLRGCTGLEGAEALQGLTGLPRLEVLDLTGCRGLRSTQHLPPLSALKRLHLTACTSLEGVEALQGLNGLPHLEELSLSGCSGLRSTQGLPPLPALQRLDLIGCTGLNDAEALQSLAGLRRLEILDLKGCTGLDKQALAALRQALPASCRIIGPDGVFIRK